MKVLYNFILITSSLFFSFTAISQTYDFEAFNAPYVEMTGGTDLTGVAWDDPNLAIPIGFQFPFFDEMLSTLYMRTDLASIVLTDDIDADTFAAIVLYDADLIDRGALQGTHLSPITYKTEGVAGNRIFTLQVKNAGFYWDIETFGSSTDFVNFQMRLYEATGTMEFHYGPNSVIHPEVVFDNSVGPGIGLVESFDFLSGVNLAEAMFLSGNPSDPDVTYSYQAISVNGTPPANTVYRFFSEPTAVREEHTITRADFYHPNPCNEYVTLREDLRNEMQSSVTVTNSLGQVVRTDDEVSQIEVDHLPSGIYQLRFKTVEGWVSQRISIVRGK